MVKNLPANAGDTGPQSRKIPYAGEQPSPWATTNEPAFPRAQAPQQENLPQRQACASQEREAPAHHNQRKPVRSIKDPAQPKIHRQ